MEEGLIKLASIRRIDNDKLTCSLITSAFTLHAWSER